MASNRHLGRIVALQTLYEYEFRVRSDDKSADIHEILLKNIEPYESSLGDKDFVRELVDGVFGHLQDLDEKIQPMAPEWPLDQISAIDRNVLRIGVYELVYCKETVPPKVAINEAVELAKAFGSDNSSKFINGVLGTAYREFVEGSTDDSSKEEPAATEGGAGGE
ncbi:MAG: transcription antitermination factor NusB [Candidatus Nomurabacteria bacterium]|jgi:N utilization substance protein B|nr:transcription antitermination factor NusB [Candidatus Nomurabacteria bacterium]